jgi:hypothetical protein
MPNVIEMRRAGMGSFEMSGMGAAYNPLADPNYVPGLFGDEVWTTPTYTPQPSQPSQPGVWNTAGPILLGGVIKDLHDIFTDPDVSIAQARSTQQAYPQYTQSQLLALNKAPTTFGADSSGVNFLGAKIPWVVVIIGSLILFFPGFQRRSK